MNEVQHSSRAHARLGASSSHRWMMCPPSVKLSEQFEDRPSAYAEEGTFLHELCELKLHRYLGDMYPEHIEQLYVEHRDSEFYSDEAEAVTDEYVAFCIETIEAVRSSCPDPLIMQEAIEADCVQGLRIADGKVTLSAPFVEDEPNRWTAYANLLKGILRSSETATRVSIKRKDTSENEKYRANSWLMRMGFGGSDFKDTRRILMGHLTGFAAFKSTADMEAHKERQAQRRREHREEGQHVHPEA